MGTDGFAARASVIGLLLSAAVMLVWLLVVLTDVTPALGDAATAEERGRAALVEYGCTSCHRAGDAAGYESEGPGVGPPLDGIAERRYIAGRLPNTTENLVEWIVSPQEIDPGNAMPDMGVPDTIARDIVAYLYSLAGSEEVR